jgi:tryptophanyl-tRNA synthetase
MERVLSGMRPTGRLHLGHLVGALTNWRDLQNQYECLYMIADLHALTSDYNDTTHLMENIEEIVIDWLACGIDPKRAIIFRQSHIKEHAELHFLLSTITPLPWLERNPTYKEQIQELGEARLLTYGFLGYPVLQTADILLYKATIVPIGKDQQPHLDLARDIAGRFNHLYGKTFPIPEPILTEAPKLPGIDGRKMSKSYGNCIYLSDPQEEVMEKTKMMFTDPKKIRKDDPGHPEECVVFLTHKAFAKGDIKMVEENCIEGGMGCVEHKEEVGELLLKTLKPIHESRARIKEDPSMIQEILSDGRERAGRIASETIEEVRIALRME